MHTILVTGAAGYIGSVTCDLLLTQGYTIVAVDNLSRGYHSAIEYLQHKYSPEKLIFYQRDLTIDPLSDIFERHHPTVIIHFAALLNVGESWSMPEKYITNNVGGTQRLVQTALAHDVKQMVFSSSCTVYGNAQYTPIDEKHPVSDPVTPYGVSKSICEKILSLYAKTSNLQVVFLRYFNVCGASDDGSIGDSKNPSFHLVQNTVRGALGLAPFELNYAKVHTPDGSPIRDYVNVVDLGLAHTKAVEYLLRGGSSDAFNIGTGTGNSVLEIIDEVKKLTGKDFPVGQSVQPRTDEADKMIADIKKADQILDWRPQRTLAESVKTLIKWYTSHPRGWNG